jgi:cytosine/adenosine deaminase-related metal-dependent hydrolase
MGATEDSGAALDAMREIGVRGTVYREVFGPAPAHAAARARPAAYRVDAMRAAETDLVRVGVSPHAPYTVSDDLFRMTADYARAEGLPVAVHTAEAEAEHQLVTSGTARSPLDCVRAASPPRHVRARPSPCWTRTGVLATRPLLIHCVLVDAEDVQRIADSGAAVAHCPTANARLGQGIAPVVELLEAGAHVALGTDSVASNNRVDMLEEARTAQLLQRARLASAPRCRRNGCCDSPPSTARALSAATTASVRSSRQGADLCAVRVTAPHTRPNIDPVATLFLSARGSDVMLTVVQGRPLYRAGRFTTVDPDAISHRIDELGARLLAARERAVMRQRLRGATELLDAPRHDRRELEHSLDQVAEVNRLLGGRRAVWHALRPLLSRSDTTTILDVGTGSADIPVDIARRARRADLRVAIIASDVHAQIRQIAAARTAGLPAVSSWLPRTLWHCPSTAMPATSCCSP